MGFLEWKKASYTEFRSLLEKGDVLVIMPTGSIEQHGPPLPLETDCFIAEKLSVEVGRHVGERLGVNVITAPPLCPGLSAHWKSFPGTLTLTTSSFSSAFVDLLTQILGEVTTHVLILNGHGGNSGLIGTLLDELQTSYPEAVLIHTDWWRMLGDEGMKIFEGSFFAHADEVETSVFLALGGELRAPLPREGGRAWPFRIEPSKGASASVYWPADLGNGVFGEPWLASREKGERALGVLKDNYLALLDRVFRSQSSYTHSI